MRVTRSLQLLGRRRFERSTIRSTPWSTGSLQRLREAVSSALSSAGVAHRVQSAGSLFSVFFTDQQVVDYAGAQSQETFRYTAFFHSMLSQGVYLPPSAFEAWFLSAAHDDDAISQVIDALPAAAAAAAAATPESA